MKFSRRQPKKGRLSRFRVCLAHVAGARMQHAIRASGLDSSTMKTLAASADLEIPTIRWTRPAILTKDNHIRNWDPTPFPDQPPAVPPGSTSLTMFLTMFPKFAIAAPAGRGTQPVRPGMCRKREFLAPPLAS